MEPSVEKPVSLETATTHILEECRMVLPGIQALFGFQLIAVFNEGFSDRLSAGQQWLHLAAIALVALAIALVMAPAALHRQVDPQAVSQRFIDLASTLLLASMFPLVLGLALEVYLVADLIAKNDLVAALIALGVAAAFAALWIALPRRERARHPPR